MKFSLKKLGKLFVYYPLNTVFENTMRLADWALGKWFTFNEGDGGGGHGGSGAISIQGTQWLRGGKPVVWVAKSIDWAVQPTSLDGFRAVVDHDSARGINLYWAYAGPGLGKKLHTPNGGGPPYSDPTRLKRNEGYWTEVDQRIRYANAHGISVVVANSFPDQNILGIYSQPALMADWQETVRRYRGYSVIFQPMSEYQEGGSAATKLALWMVDATRQIGPDVPVGLHPQGGGPRGLNAGRWTTSHIRGSISGGSNPNSRPANPSCVPKTNPAKADRSRLTG